MNDTLVVDINLGSLGTSSSFLKIMSEKLYFPDYFGFNYDALDECMQDLSWLPEEKIIINFRFIERIKRKNESLYKIIYDCLVMYQEYWDSEYEQEFVDFFRKNHQLLRLNNADDLRIFIEAYYSDQCNFEIFNSELLAELAKYKVSLPISVYYCDND